MKVKPPKVTITVELEPYEVKEIVEEIEAVVQAYSGEGLFPLVLHDFAQQLKESQR